jgi:two-component system, chemotaxis family, sensor histidine kinase and response regulator WspE
VSQQNLGDFSMLDLFQMEAQSHAADLRQGLAAMSQNFDSIPNDEFAKLIRAAHSIRGAAKIVQLDAIASLAAALENCFVACLEKLFQPKSKHFQIFQQTADLLAETGSISLEKMPDFLEMQAAQIALLTQNLQKAPHSESTPEPELSSSERKEICQSAEVMEAMEIIEANLSDRQTPQLIESPLSDTIPDLSDLSMLELFRMEVESQVDVLNQGLLQLEENPNAFDSIEPLMRAAHSIKGAARIVQLDVAVQLAHVLEDCFVSAQAGTIAIDSNHIDVFLECVDILLNVSTVPASEMSGWISENRARVGKILAAIAEILPQAQRQLPGIALGSSESVNLLTTPVPSQSDSLPIAPNAEPNSIEPNLQSIPQLNTSTTSPKSNVEMRSAVTNSTSPSLTQSPRGDKSDKIAERVVRVSTDNLNRLMGLAGESLVEANWLQPFADSLLKLKYLQAETERQMEALYDSLAAKKQLSDADASQFKALRQTADRNRQFLTDRLSELEVFARRSANLSDRLYREVIASHMRPFADGVQGFPRMIRDLAKKLGKQVKLEIIGKSTQVDRDIIEKLEAPLTHILRNAVDHGLELPEERIAAGKTPEGTIRLEAMHRAGMLSITVSDDGRGMSPESIRQKVIDKKLTSPQMAAQLTEIELMDFLFLPGFSTAKQVTEISGRGVGLDIVQNMVQQVGGIVRASSQTGKSMTFHLQLPLTLSVIRSLLVEISGEPYAFPLTRIDHIVLLSKSEIRLVENRQYFTFDRHNIGLVVACQVLELRESQLNLEELPVIIISDRYSLYGVVVDKFLGERELVVRPLDARLGKVPNISAAALMEDGPPILIIDVEDMVRSIDKLLTGNKLDKVSEYEDKKAIKVRKRILVVDDSITVREMERKLLESKGYEVEVAVDGMEGWNVVRTGDFHLIVSDVDMPRMNGIELVSNIKSHPMLKSLPVIIVSYKDRQEDRLRGLEVGADYYLTKSSFHDNTLIQAVQDLIGV